MSTSLAPFDPMSDLFVAQFAKPAHLGQINLRTLTPFQRTLLVIDGTVTKFIEAYTMEPVEIIRISQANQILSSEHQWLKAPTGTAVMARHVILRGKYSYTVYAYALSLIIPDRLQAVVKEGLEVDGEGIGRILQNSHLETYREILWYGREQVQDLPDIIKHLEKEEFISRTYRIMAGGQPLMLINEKFPFNNAEGLPLHH